MALSGKLNFSLKVNYKLELQSLTPAGKITVVQWKPENNGIVRRHLKQ